MTTSTFPGVRTIGSIQSLFDETREPLYAAVSEAADRSSTSDELAGKITDWPSRYDLSRLRRNILMPLHLNPGTRVLDVGCGTGPVTRALAERGARVTGLESSLARARVAAARTSGQVNCDIVSGSLADYVAEGHPGEFDLVFLCGVLGNANYDDRAFGDPRQSLADAKELVKPGGAVVISLENQLGLKYLLGYPEDRRGVPWVGIDGFRSGRNPARTWSRATLAEMLSDAGLSQQEWLYPYPDHTLPTVISRADLFETAEGRALLQLFVRKPVQDYAAGAMLVADPVAAFRTMLTAGLGRDTANSFLVVAGVDGSEPSRHVEEGSLWISSSERLAELQDQRHVLRRGDGWTLTSLNQRQEVHMPPLVSRRTDSLIVLGSNLEDEIVELAAQVQSPRDLQALLKEWWSAAIPWLKPGEYHVDVMPRNFIRDPSGQWIYVDREWTWQDDVPQSWALLRSMWFLALDRLWPAGATAGLSWNLTLGELVLGLARVVEPNLRQQDLSQAVKLEARLQSRVSGNAEAQESQQLHELLARPLTALSTRPALAQILERPLIVEADASERELAADLRELQAKDDIIGNQAELESMRWQIQDLEAKLRWLRGRDPKMQMQKARSAAGRVKRRVLG